MKVALVGAGVIAVRYAECIRAQPRLTLLGATDPLPGRAAALGAAEYPSLDALLADDAVELVVVLTPPSLHAARRVPVRIVDDDMVAVLDKPPGPPAADHPGADERHVPRVARHAAPARAARGPRPDRARARSWPRES